MVKFKTIVKKFDKQGEKTGWTYVEFSQKIAQQLKPGNKRSFRVKGTIDEYKISAVALIPMGEGDFIMALNATMRKAIRKRAGDIVMLQVETDNEVLKISPALMECLADEPEAAAFFNSLPGSHQQYFSRWIESAKTDATKTKRIAMAINAFSKKLGYSQMMQLQKKNV